MFRSAAVEEEIMEKWEKTVFKIEIHEYSRLLE